MTLPAKWRVISQINRIDARGLITVATFYVTYQDPVTFKSVRWTHTPEPEHTKGKSYIYEQGYEQMRRTYRELISGDTPYTENKPMLSKEEIWSEIKRCREKENQPQSKSSKYFQSPEQ